MTIQLYLTPCSRICAQCMMAAILLVAEKELHVLYSVVEEV